MSCTHAWWELMLNSLHPCIASSQVVGGCIGYLSDCCHRAPRKSNVRQARFPLAHSQTGQPIKAGEGSASSVALAVVTGMWGGWFYWDHSQETERYGCWPSACFLLFSHPLTLDPGIVLPALKANFSSVKPLWKHPVVCLLGDSKSSQIDNRDEWLQVFTSSGYVHELNATV